MRTQVLLAIAGVVCAVTAGCSAGTHEDSRNSQSTASTQQSTSPSTTSPHTASVTPSTAPAAGAAMSDVVRWIEAGAPADPSAYRNVTLDGASTPLAVGVAFVTAGVETNCVTNRYADGALACLVKLTNPPPRPTDFPSAWKNNWVDFTGASVDVGSPHGDPGPFGAGSGADLPNGHTLAFADYRCRADAGGLFCVNYAHQSAVRMSAAGIEPFGCLQKVTPPPDIGIRFSC